MLNNTNATVAHCTDPIWIQTTARRKTTERRKINIHANPSGNNWPLKKRQSPGPKKRWQEEMTCLSKKEFKLRMTKAVKELREELKLEITKMHGKLEIYKNECIKDNTNGKLKRMNP